MLIVIVAATSYRCQVFAGNFFYAFVKCLVLSQKSENLQGSVSC